ncbi:pilus assembly protein [Microbacteriaceae bacterium VKM Ac-2855]|nr:pilus assembly protein [Microbacteriaceae bacterium VKM Ac-2855]
MIRIRSDRGSAALEFLGVGVLVFVPLVYLVLALGSLQAAVMATTSAARDAVRSVTTGSTWDPGDAVALAATDFGIDPERMTMRIECADPSCAAGGTAVVARVRAEIPLPFMPGVFGLDRAVVILVQGSAAGRIDRFGVGR